MGRDKALLEVDGRRLVDIAADLVAAVSVTAIEVGPGFSELPAVREEPPGGGPLAAFVAGGAALATRGNELPLLVLAVDMPFVTLDLLRLLAEGASLDLAVVPEVESVAQPLCAVFPPTAVAVASQILAEGRRSMNALLDVIPVRRLLASEWSGVASPDAFTDLDTPADLLEVRAPVATRAWREASLRRPAGSAREVAAQ